MTKGLFHVGDRVMVANNHLSGFGGLYGTVAAVILRAGRAGESVLVDHETPLPGMHRGPTAGKRLPRATGFWYHRDDDLICVNVVNVRPDIDLGQII